MGEIRIDIKVLHCSTGKSKNFEIDCLEVEKISKFIMYRKWSCETSDRFLQNLPEQTKVNLPRNKTITIMVCNLVFSAISG